MCTAMREFLRKAGDRIRAFDDAYSDKLIDGYLRWDDRIQERGGATPAEVLGMTAGVLLSSPSTRKFTAVDGMTPEQVPNYLKYGVPAASAVAKYGLPAAGIGLGAKGIYDMTQMLTQQTEGTLPPT